MTIIPGRLIAEAEALEAVAARLRAMAADAAPAPSPPPPVITPPPVGGAGLQVPAAFFASLKRSDAIFPADSLNQGQVDGINAICAAAAGKCPTGWAAYVLATAYHETDATFDPDTVESLNYSVEALISKFSRERISVADAQRYGRAAGQVANQEAIANLIYGGAWGRKNLGNTEPGDGWKFRGRSWPQFTGRRNAERIDDALGLGGALVANPELYGRLGVCGPGMVEAMVNGWFTGLDMNEFIGGKGTLSQFAAARQVVNGTDRADDIAKYAMAFQDALLAGGWL